MKIINCHTHTGFSHDGTGTLEELVEYSKAKGLRGFAVSDHLDCEYSEDKTMNENIRSSFYESYKAKEKYNNELIISCGVELGEAIINPTYAKKIILSYEWDVILGSVHAVRIEDFEMPFSVIDFSKSDDEFIDRYVSQYFLDVLETAKSTDFDILCHLTVVLRYIVYKYKRTVDIKKHYPVIAEILKTVIKRDKTLEVNTSGVKDGYFMPDKDILIMYRELGGKRITLGSDSHIPENLDTGLEEGVNFLRSLGFSKLTYYLNRKPFEYLI